MLVCIGDINTLSDGVSNQEHRCGHDNVRFHSQHCTFPSARTFSMTLSARNRLPGVIEEIQPGGVMAHVSVRVGENLVESVITRRSAEEMKLAKGDKVLV